LHGTQRKISADVEGVVIEIEVQQNFELPQLILSMGQQVQVLAPESLRQRIAYEPTQALKRYEAG